MRKKFLWFFIIGILICSLSIAFVRIDHFQRNKEIKVASNENEDNPIRRIAENINTDWGLDAINLKSYKYNSTKRNVVVALIDTGVNVSSQNILEGYNILNNSKNVSDNTGHGTDVAKIIFKVNPSVNILPIKIIDNSSDAKPEDLAKAIRYAVEKKQMSSI